MEDLEALFLTKKYDQALTACKKELKQLKSTNNNVSSEITNTKLTQNILTPQIVSDSIPLMSMVVQSLYELKRTPEIMPFVTNFYGCLEAIPTEISIMCLNVQLEQNKYADAEEFLGKLIFKHSKKTQKCCRSDNGIPDNSSNEKSLDYERLVEYLLFCVYVPTERISDAIEFLQINANNLNEEKAMSFRLRLSKEKEDYEKKLANTELLPRSPSGRIRSSSHPKKTVTWDLSVIDPKERRSSKENIGYPRENRSLRNQLMSFVPKHLLSLLKDRYFLSLISVISFLLFIKLFAQKPLYNLVKKIITLVTHVMAPQKEKSNHVIKVNRR